MARDAAGERLTTWAEIGAHIGRDARTAKRYEAARGLPVRRMPGDAKSTVYAFRSELDAWMARRSPSASAPFQPRPSPATAEPAGATAAPWRPTTRQAVALALLAAVAVLLAAGGVAWRLGSPSGSAARGARPLYQQAVYAWSRRTPEGIREAIDLFTQAIVADPSYAAAYVGLADCYNLAPEFAGMRPADAYPRALAAARRAIALDPSSAAAHRTLAFADFWWAHDVDGGFAQFRRSLKLDPYSGQTHHWYANALAARAEPSALDEINAAAALAPSTPVMTDKGWVLLMLGRYGEADQVLRQVVQLDPGYAAAHADLADLAHRRGDVPGELAEARQAAELRRDAGELAIVRVAQDAFAKGGRPAMLDAVAAGREALLARTGASAYEAAKAEAALRRRGPTLALLRRAHAEHDPAMLSLDATPDFAWLRSDPEFRRLQGA